MVLAACRINVAATGVADGGLDAVHGQTTLQRLDLLDRRRAERAVGNVVHLDEIHMAKRAGAEVDKGLHLRVGVVDAVDHGEFVSRAAPGLLDVLLDGRRPVFSTYSWMASCKRRRVNFLTPGIS